MKLTVEQIKEVLSEILGLTDIAETLGISKQNVVRRKDTKDFPKPIGIVGGRPVWWIEDISTYAEKKGIDIKSFTK